MAKGASARAAARKQRDKWKAKRWYTIRAPRTPWSFRVIGETLAEEPEQLIGRNYEVIQNELDGDFSKMHVKVVFRVTDVLGNDAITEFVGHELLKDHVRRQVRRDRGKIDDTIDVCVEAWKRNECKHYSISSKRSYSIIGLAKMFKTKITYLKPRLGERYASALTSMNLSNKVFKIFGKIKLKEYVEDWKKTLKQRALHF